MFLLMFCSLLHFFTVSLYIPASSLSSTFNSSNLTCPVATWHLFICDPSVWHHLPLWSRHDQDSCAHWVGIHQGTVSPAWNSFETATQKYILAVWLDIATGSCVYVFDTGAFVCENQKPVSSVFLCWPLATPISLDPEGAWHTFNKPPLAQNK